MNYKKLAWSFTDVWNSAFEEEINDREFTARNYIYASELGKSQLDIYLKMKGVEPSNKPNARAFRKFEAGNIWESIVKIILIRAGILMAEQQQCNCALDGCVEVHGRFDFKAGGDIDWDKAQRIANEEFSWLPERTKLASQKIIMALAKAYPTGLKPLILDVKSCSAFMFDVYSQTDKPSENHALQIYHYLKSLNMEEGHLIYISRDDVRMYSYGVFLNDKEIKDRYEQHIKEISYFYLNDIQPPKEPLIAYDEERNRFTANWKVQYSNYLTLIYGFKDETDFGDWSRKVQASWNRTYQRAIEGKKMTKLNLTVLDQIRKSYPELDAMIEIAKEKTRSNA